MITTTINVYVNSYAMNGEITVPTPVLTSTVQNEEFDPQKSPNYILKVQDTYSYVRVTDTVYVELSYGSYNYSSYANVINVTNGVATLQYVDGMTSSYVEPEPQEDYTEIINQILGTSYSNVVNDISEEDTLAAANNILYGDEEPPLLHI